MRTTVDLPPAAHRRAKRLAAARGVSLSAMVSELTLRGLAHTEEPASEEIERDPVTGFILLRVGHPITSDSVAALLDDE